jgi:hypothetical protein
MKCERYDKSTVVELSYLSHSALLVHDGGDHACALTA